MSISELLENLSNFECYLYIPNHDCTVISLSETWLNDNGNDLYGLWVTMSLAIIELIQLVQGRQFVLKIIFISQKDHTSPILVQTVKQSSLK